MRYLLFGLLAAGLFAQKTSIPNPNVQYFDNSGQVCTGCKLYTYVAGGVTPLATYTSSSGATPNADPVVLDSAGRANVWTTPGVSYRFDLYTGANVLLWSVDNIPGGSTAGASTVTANFIYAGPCTGPAAAPAFRIACSQDVPNNAANTSGNAASASALDHNPSPCSANQFVNDVDAAIVLGCAQPALNNIAAGPVPAGSTLSYIEPQDLLLTACDNVTPIIYVSHPTANPSASTCITGTNTQQGYEIFSATTQTFQVRTVLPDDWVSGAGNDVVLYFADVTDTNAGHSEVFNLATACAAVTGSSDPTFNAAQKPSRAVNPGSAGTLNTATQATFTTTGCSAGNILYLKVGLDSTRTATGNAGVFSIHLKLKVTKVAL